MFTIRKLILAPVLAGLAATAACTGDPAPPPPDRPVSSPSPSQAGPHYDAAGLDLCAGTDLTALGELATTRTSAAPRDGDSGPGSACLFELADARGRPVDLLVSASALTDAAAAERSYRGQLTRDGVSSVDRAFDRPGTEAQGLILRKDYDDSKTTGYVAHAREGNLEVLVWISLTTTDGFAETGPLADAAYAVLADTWPQVTER